MRKAIRRSPDSCWQRLWRNNFYGIISVVPKKILRKGVIIISGILSYSGISAKARAMGGKLLKKEQYEQLASCASVGEAVGYLRQFSEYEPLLRDFDEHDSHRGMIEATLMGSLYNDYNRLYSFARGEQRALFGFLPFCTMRRHILRVVFEKSFPVRVSKRIRHTAARFFARHSHLDTDAIENSTTVDELIDAFKKYTVLSSA